MVSLEAEIRNVLRTGKVVLGARRTLKLAKLGKLRAIIMASAAPPEIKSDVRYYAKLSGIPVFEYRGTSIELGALCGKPFSVAVIGVIDPGESRLLEAEEGG